MQDEMEGNRHSPRVWSPLTFQPWSKLKYDFGHFRSSAACQWFRPVAKGAVLCSPKCVKVLVVVDTKYYLHLWFDVQMFTSSLLMQLIWQCLYLDGFCCLRVVLHLYLLLLSCFLVVIDMGTIFQVLFMTVAHFCSSVTLCGLSFS